MKRTIFCPVVHQLDVWGGSIYFCTLCLESDKNALVLEGNCPNKYNNGDSTDDRRDYETDESRTIKEEEPA